MANKFHDQASYIAAFLAVAVGLMIFRPELTGYSISLFNHSFNLFQLMAVFVATLVVGTYFGALAVMSSALNITAFPLTRRLEQIANFISGFGLVLPMMLFAAMAFAHIASMISDNQQLFNLVSPFISLLLGLFTSYKIMTSREKKQIEDNYREIEKNNLYINYHSIQKKDKQYEFLEHYEYVVGYAREYLRSRGYGVRTNSLVFVGKLLRDKEIISDNDYRQLIWVTNMRNNLAHAKSKPSVAQLEKSKQILEQLFTKLRERFVELVDNADEHAAEL